MIHSLIEQTALTFDLPSVTFWWHAVCHWLYKMDDGRQINRSLKAYRVTHSTFSSSWRGPSAMFAPSALFPRAYGIQSAAAAAVVAIMMSQQQQHRRQYILRYVYVL